MVGRDFFRWHQAVQAAQPHLFCSIAVRNHNRTVQCPDDPQGYYLSSGDYCSWGVCFERSVLIDLVARHVSHDYLARPKAYLRRHFSASRVSLGFVEQASLLRRIQERCGRPIVYPAVPRAFHAGFYGRNRPGAVCGGLESKVRELNDVIYDPVAMRRVAVNERYADDSVPVNLQLHTQAEPRQIRPLEVA